LIVVVIFKRIALCWLACFGLMGTVYAQETPPVYPRIAGYVGILHPLVTFSGEGTVTNFKSYYIVGLPTGINIWKSAKIGFSVEIVPLIRAENGTSKVSNLLYAGGSGGFRNSGSIRFYARSEQDRQKEQKQWLFRGRADSRAFRKRPSRQRDHWLSVWYRLLNELIQRP
jgi:hypothetical protein